MNQGNLSAWFTANQKLLEAAYTAEVEPWKQSGFSGPQERWDICRKPIADCIDLPGSFLDIGCANGYLLESLVNWTAARDLEIQPYGLDISAKLADLAKKRLPKFANHIFVGNAWTFVPPMKFDFVRVEVVYVPENLGESFVRRSLKFFVKPGGKLIVADYRSCKDNQPKPWIDEVLLGWGFKVGDCQSAYHEGKELTRIATIKNFYC
jgi:SAM-dependent methyltransferase